MAPLKISKFRGTAPRNAPEHLSETSASVARNCKLYSGDLIPFPRPVVAANAGRTGTIRTLYGLRDTTTDAIKWLTWSGDVNVVTPATDEFEEQRFYYTGDGKPKVSTYALATSGTGPYPSGSYDLGLPLPTAKLVATATAFSTLTSVSVARDSANNVTIKTAASHGIRSGALISVTGFAFFTGTYSRNASGLITCAIAAHGLVTGASVLLVFTSGGATSNRYPVTVTSTDTFTCQDVVAGSTSGNVSWDVRDLNTTVEVTAVDDTTLSYFSSGVAFTTRATADGRIALGGQVQARSYVYTWITPWGEESIASEPSDPLFVQEGQTITVTNLPNGPPPGSNFIRGIRLYRSQAGTVTDAAYLRLATMWFPARQASGTIANNLATITTKGPHNLSVGDRVGVIDQYAEESSPSVPPIGAFNFINPPAPAQGYSGAVVKEVLNKYTFTFEAYSANVTAATVATAVDRLVVAYDVSENPPSSTARFWRRTPETAYPFVDDFSFRSLTTVLNTDDYDPPPEGLAGLTVMQNNVLAGFVGNDLYFSEPETFHAWPVAYKRSFDDPIVGLAQVGGRLLVMTTGYPYVVEGSDPAIVSISRLSARYPCTSKRSIVETSFGVVYATFDGLVVYSPATAAQLLTKAIHSSDSWSAALDPTSLVAVLHKEGYFASHATAAILYESATGDRDSAPFFVDIDFTFTAAWHDKRTGRLYLVSGTAGDIYQWDAAGQPPLDMRWRSKRFVLPDPVNMGAARVVAEYGTSLGSPFWDDIDTTWETTDIFWDQADPLTFRLYANEAPVMVTTCGGSDVFRLPAGYKTDTYEVEVEGSVRVRSIHLGETPSSLRKV